MMQPRSVRREHLVPLALLALALLALALVAAAVLNLLPGAAR
jgi:hypothetical protein